MDEIAEQLITIRDSDDDRAVTEAMDDLTRRCIGLTRQWSSLIGDDAEQLARIAIWEGARGYTYDPERPAKAFLFCVVRRRIVTAVKKAQKTPPAMSLNSTHVRQDEGGTLADIIPYPRRHEHASLEDRELAHLTREWLKRTLSTQEYTCLFWRLKGITYGEIESRTGLKFKQIDNALRRVEGKLATSRPAAATDLPALMEQENAAPLTKKRQHRGQLCQKSPHTEIMA